MKQVDEARLETDLEYRYEYLVDFVGFNKDDIATIHAIAARLTPLIPALVDATYAQLLCFDATARHFLPRQSGYEGALPDSLDGLSAESEQIQFRKEHLRRYLMSVVGNPYDARMVRYLDVVGKMHTPKSGNKSIDVPLVQMNALMGLLSDLLTKCILDMGLEREEEGRALRAFNKLLWVQNDLINRHYAEEPPPPTTEAPAASAWR